MLLFLSGEPQGLQPNLVHDFRNPKHSKMKSSKESRKKKEKLKLKGDMYKKINSIQITKKGGGTPNSNHGYNKQLPLCSTPA